ncbi:MAG: benzoate-CoA ligase family protein, partial [Gammaproteobacteria bacterium]|nr:benzoate-CoA ligase family protein [Gammaproteobacteria bacterium]
MPELSTADHDRSPPGVTLPRQYNAACDLIERNLVAGHGTRLAYIDDSSRCSFEELAERTARFANGLVALGLEPEQRVLLCMLDTIDLPVAFLGSIRAGLVPVPVNTLLMADDYAFMLEDSRASLAVISAPFLPVFEPLLARLPRLRGLLVSGAPADEHRSIARLLAGAAGEARYAATTRDDTCFWLYSSGSTGRPKGAVHVQSSPIHTAELYARPYLGLSPADVVLSAPKLFFAYGLGNALSFPLAAGATTVLMAERPTPAGIFARLRTHRPTVFYGVPTLYAAMLASPDLPEPGAFRLRRCVSAGEPLPEDIGRRWSQRYGVDILDGIGSTEMLHIFLSNAPGDVRYGTTGRPVPGYEVRLLDEAGRPVAPGEIGELQVAGPTSATMYWNNRDQSRQTFEGCWTRSGDKFSVTADGRYVYAGRSDDMLKVSGLYVSPAEVEAALISHPAVLEAAVVGRADGDGLIKPAAYVVLRPAIPGHAGLAEELRQHVKALLAPYKYPRWIEFIGELPRTATGKIQRFRLRGR